MMEHIGMRHTDRVADIGERHRTRAAFEQELARCRQSFLAHFVAGPFAPLRSRARRLVHPRHGLAPTMASLSPLAQPVQMQQGRGRIGEKRSRSVFWKLLQWGAEKTIKIAVNVRSEVRRIGKEGRRKGKVWVW